MPLSAEAIAVLKSVPHMQGHDLVFGRGAGGFAGWSKAKRELDARIAAARKAAGVRQPMAPWTLHDLRRSVATLLNESRTRIVETPNGPKEEAWSFAEPHVIEMLLNHVSGHKAAIAGIYNQATYLDARRLALKRWGEHVAALVANHKPLSGQQMVHVEKSRKFSNSALSVTPA